MSAVYFEFHHWSPMLGCDAVRIGMAGPRGQEYFAIIPATNPGYRKRRADTLAELVAAIDRGDPPGEVAVVHAMVESGTWPAP